MADQSVTTKGEAKRLAILAAARGAFLAGGFHATSMQDLLKATGQTPGGFYRYFPSKDALIQALAADAIGQLSATVVATMDDAPGSVAKALAPAIQTIDAMERRNGTARLALLIWAEAQRSAEIAQLIGAAIRPMLEALDHLAASLVARAIVDACYESREVAVMLGGILQGYVVQRAMFGIDAVTYELGLRAISGYHAA